jgi:IS1 family transposase
MHIVWYSALTKWMRRVWNGRSCCLTRIRVKLLLGRFQGVALFNPKINTIYDVSKSVNAGTQFFQRLHAIDADTKLVISHLVGKRDATSAYYFMRDLKDRLATRVQLTTDGFRSYISAVDDTIGTEVDYAQLVKIYGAPKASAATARNYYEPARVAGAIPMAVMGRPKAIAVSTSYVERQNLTMRMQMWRFTWLTSGYYKKLDNRTVHIALHFAYYNFVRVHQTLRVTPAMAANLTDHLWTLEELLGSLQSSATS